MKRFWRYRYVIPAVLLFFLVVALRHYNVLDDGVYNAIIKQILEGLFGST